MEYQDKRIKLVFTALVVAVSTFTTGAFAEQPIFKNARDIPAPSKNSEYISLPKNTKATDNPIPKNMRTTVSQQPITSLTDARNIAQDSISLDAATLKQQTVVIDNDDTHVVAVSQGNMNRINTPFKNPIVLVNGGAKYKVIGQDVYVVMQSDQPIGVFVREDDNISNNSPVASLTLVPKPIAPQNIAIVLENALRERLSNPNQKIATDYQDVIRQNLANIAQGKLPDGYSRSNVNSKAIARVGAVVLRPKVIYSGVENNIYAYTAQNVTNQYVELSEPSFWHKGVRAVAFNGNIKLAPNETTEILIIADLGNGDDSIYD